MLLQLNKSYLIAAGLLYLCFLLATSCYYLPIYMRGGHNYTPSIMYFT